MKKYIVTATYPWFKGSPKCQTVIVGSLLHDTKEEAHMEILRDLHEEMENIPDCFIQIMKQGKGEVNIVEPIERYLKLTDDRCVYEIEGKVQILYRICPINFD